MTVDGWKYTHHMENDLSFFFSLSLSPTLVHFTTTMEDAPTNNCSALLHANTTQIYFGATPHTLSEFKAILEWVGGDGLLLDLRVDKERAGSETTPFQYHTRAELIGRNYLHYPITDRSVPIPKRLVSYRALIQKTVTHPRVYVHCRGGHGRAGVVVACMLMYYGATSSSVLESVHEAHSIRILSRRLRKLGAPQNAKQKQYVHDFTMGMEDDADDDHTTGDQPIQFCEPNGEYGYLSNLWGTPGTHQWRKLGGPTHLIIEGLSWPTVEHYVQAQKFNLQGPYPGESLADFETMKLHCHELARYIRQAATSTTVFRLGNIGHADRRKSGYSAQHRLYPEPGVAAVDRRAPTINSIVERFHGRVRIRKDWETYRNTVLLVALRCKFSNIALRDLLLATENRTLHDTKRDFLGMDQLGPMLGRVRSELRALKSMS